MKKLMLAMVLAAVAAMGLSSVASATISSPNAITGSGTVTLRGTIIATTCNISVSATRVSGTQANVTAATFAGCGQGATIQALGLPWPKTITLSPRTFTISNVQVALTAPIVGTCLYRGTLSGTYTVGANSTLTITSDTLTRVSGGSLCTADPAVTGTIRTNATTV